MPPGTLFVVATPIGHLEDISLRALRVLKTVALIAAEDTRRTAKLLRHYDISTPILSVHAHNEHSRIPRVLGRLRAGESVALVTDAGTPGISDPGAPVVAAARAEGFRVEPIPGPSAVVAALSAAGIAGGEGFAFLGFPPIRGNNRKQWLAELAQMATRRAVVFYEAPHRIFKTIEEIASYVKQPIILARELTKIHEEFMTGTPGELLKALESPVGEFTVVVPPAPHLAPSADALSDDSIGELFGQIANISAATTKREAARAVAERLGLTTKQVYDALERLKLGRTT